MNVVARERAKMTRELKPDIIGIKKAEALE